VAGVCSVTELQLTIDTEGVKRTRNRIAMQIRFVFPAT
jgi:hypothetical protein